MRNSDNTNVYDYAVEPHTDAKYHAPKFTAKCTAEDRRVSAIGYV